MKRIALIFLATAAAVLTPKERSFGDVINFDYLQQTDELVHFWGPAVDVDGYRFVSVPPPGNVQRFGTLGTLSPFFPERPPYSMARAMPKRSFRVRTELRLTCSPLISHNCRPGTPTASRSTWAPSISRSTGKGPTGALCSKPSLSMRLSTW